jgi:hypothetical protein
VIENVVGETGFEPATLCSQSKQYCNEISEAGVNRAEKIHNAFNGMGIPV